MKMNDNSIMNSLEKQLNCILKKRVSGDLLQTHPRNSDQCSSILKFLNVNKIEFFSSQPKNERPKKILLMGIPKTYEISEVKNALTQLNFDIHRVSQLWNNKTKELYPFYLVDILLSGNYLDLYKLDSLLGYVIKSAPYKSRGPKQCYNCKGFSHSSDNCHFEPKCNKCAGSYHYSLYTIPKDNRQNIKYINCGNNHITNLKGCPKNLINMKKLNPNQNTKN